MVVWLVVRGPEDLPPTSKVKFLKRMSGRKVGRAYGSSSRVRASMSGMPVIIQSRAPLLPKAAPKTNLQNSIAIGDAAKRGDAASDDQSSLKADPKKSAQALNLMMSPVVKSDDEEEDEMELENVGEFSRFVKSGLISLSS